MFHERVAVAFQFFAKVAVYPHPALAVVLIYRFVSYQYVFRFLVVEVLEVALFQGFEKINRVMASDGVHRPLARVEIKALKFVVAETVTVHILGLYLDAECFHAVFAGNFNDAEP